MALRPGDEARLRLMVGAATMARGRDYAAGAAVLSSVWDPEGTSVHGEVRGTGPTPYRVEVFLARGSGVLIDLDGRCTCPVGVNCKHCVALLLAPSRGPAPAAPARPARAAAWERALRPLLDTADRPERSETADLALQFELAPRPGRSGVRNPAPRQGIRLRPVVRSTKGNWVRTGISWSTLRYMFWGQSQARRAADHVRLLRELQALGTAGAHSWAGEDTVWLETIDSRRVWDLLLQARDTGLPFVVSGKAAAPVVLAGPLTAALDLSRDRRGDLILRGRIKGDGPEDDVAPDSALWIGHPAHGVAWQTVGPDGRIQPELHLAPLSHPLTDQAADLLLAPPIRVPAAEVARFDSEAYPTLRRRLPLSSSDGSVELPEITADVVVCSVAAGGAGVEVAWAIAAGGRYRHVWDDAEGTAAAAALDVVATVPGMSIATPWGQRLAVSVSLHGLDAVRFVGECLPALESMDGVRVERVGDLPDYREVTDAPVVQLGGEASAGGDWFDLAVEVSVGGEAVAYGDLFVALASGASHMVLPSGTYFALDRPELAQLAELIEEARSLQDAPPGRVRVGRLQASLWDELEALGVPVDGAEEWSRQMAALVAAGDAEPPALPTGLEATLRPYQVDGFGWLAARYGQRIGGILADDMGLGKTLQALALVAHAAADAPFLVVAPTSVVGNWISETARFLPGERAVAIRETAARRGVGLAEAVKDAGLVVTSYTLFRLEHDEYAALPWAGLLLDEAQFAKNPASHNHRCARKLPAPWKLAMTGTPLENSLTELWALVSITAPGLLPRPDRFAADYRTPIERHGSQDRLARLRRRIRPVMLRRTKDAVAADLPEKQERVLTLDLEAGHRRFYDTLLARERQKVLGLLGDLDGNRFEVLRSLTLLRQAALDVSLVDAERRPVPSAKLDALVEMLGEAVADGHRVLVFSQFTRFLGMARTRVEAAGIDCCYLDGRTRKRDAVIERFRSGATPVFLISLKAGGVGLNLTEADHCILLDPWWNPATEAQAVDRAHRIGQTRKVMVHRFVARSTIEEKVMELKGRKAALFASVVDGGGFESAALTAADVRELLA